MFINLALLKAQETLVTSVSCWDASSPVASESSCGRRDHGTGWICFFLKPVTHLPCCLTGLQRGMLNPLSQVLIQKSACAWLRLFTLHSMLCHSRTVSSIANRSDKIKDLTRILDDFNWCIIHFWLNTSKRQKLQYTQRFVVVCPSLLYGLFEHPVPDLVLILLDVRAWL